MGWEMLSGIVIVLCQTATDAEDKARWSLALPIQSCQIFHTTGGSFFSYHIYFHPSSLDGIHVCGILRYATNALRLAFTITTLSSGPATAEELFVA
jgi:hypothetical protein